mgnify:CR=1 FL=1
MPGVLYNATPAERLAAFTSRVLYSVTDAKLTLLAEDSLFQRLGHRESAHAWLAPVTDACGPADLTTRCRRAREVHDTIVEVLDRGKALRADPTWKHLERLDQEIKRCEALVRLGWSS